MKKIILASGSARRKDLLKTIGLAFDVIPSNYEEKLDTNNFSYEAVENLALNKGKDVLAKVQDDAVIISADTVVVLDNHILGKPKDREDAFNMIKSLSGKTHKVVTAIAMIDVKSKKTVIDSTTTNVTFREIADFEIEKYVDTKEPYDKAGAYAAQGLAGVFIENIDGCFNNVVGISTFKVYKLLQEFY